MNQGTRVGEDIQRAHYLSWVSRDGQDFLPGLISMAVGVMGEQSLLTDGSVRTRTQRSRGT